jgi:hypothetical protein
MNIGRAVAPAAPLEGIVPIVAMAGDMPGGLVATAVLLAVAAAVSGLLRRWKSLEGTTLRAVWWWKLASVAALAAVALLVEPSGAGHVRYLAAVATICPAMALLGAKRPQDRGWQFVVASLWVVLALPAAQAWVNRPAAPLELHFAWRWFLLILVAVGLFNILPTRYWPSALLAGIGQAMLLSAHLPILLPGIPADHRTGAVLWCCAVALWGWDLPRRRKVQQPLDRLWLDFRDLVGALWALRVRERINAAAVQYGWRLRLGWKGWIIERPPPPSFQRSLQMLLRRFVSPAWIARRVTPADTPAGAEA